MVMHTHVDDLGGSADPVRLAAGRRCRRRYRQAAWLVVAAVLVWGPEARLAAFVVDDPRHQAPAMPQVRVLNEQQLKDMIVGAGIYCTRGNNTTAQIERVLDGYRAGQQFRLISLDDLPDQWMAFTSFTVGGGGAWAHVPERIARQGLQPPADPPAAADVLAKHLDVRFDATFQAEAGGATANALLTAARMGVPLIDACPSGRCLPEVQMSPFGMNGITRAPLSAVTPYGDVLVLSSALDDYRVEDITRGLAVASNGRVSVAANALRGDVLKRHLIPGFLSQSERVGRAAREAVERREDPVAAVAEAGGGVVLFRGVVRSSDSKAEQGFGITTAILDGVGAFRGSEYRIFNKNENMVAWRDGRLDAAAPDLIAALDPATGWAMRGGAIIGSFVVGQEIAIVGFPGPALWRTPKGIDMLGPPHFGFPDRYVPLEQLHQLPRPR